METLGAMAMDQSSGERLTDRASRVQRALVVGSSKFQAKKELNKKRGLKGGESDKKRGLKRAITRRNRRGSYSKALELEPPAPVTKEWGLSIATRRCQARLRLNGEGTGLPTLNGLQARM